jgi:glycosyltransferase A (GT-A) superfamily protein (DUF2064 family)
MLKPTSFAQNCVFHVQKLDKIFNSKQQDTRQISIKMINRCLQSVFCCFVRKVTVIVVVVGGVVVGGWYTVIIYNFTPEHLRRTLLESDCNQFLV